MVPKLTEESVQGDRGGTNTMSDLSLSYYMLLLTIFFAFVLSSCLYPLSLLRLNAMNRWEPLRETLRVSMHRTALSFLHLQEPF